MMETRPDDFRVLLGGGLVRLSLDTRLLWMLVSREVVLTPSVQGSSDLSVRRQVSGDRGVTAKTGIPLAFIAPTYPICAHELMNPLPSFAIIQIQKSPK